MFSLYRNPLANCLQADKELRVHALGSDEAAEFLLKIAFLFLFSSSYKIFLPDVSETILKTGILANHTSAHEFVTLHPKVRLRQ